MKAELDFTLEPLKNKKLYEKEQKDLLKSKENLEVLLEIEAPESLSAEQKRWGNRTQLIAQELISSQYKLAGSLKMNIRAISGKSKN